MRWETGANLHDSLMEAIYTDAARIADRAVSRSGTRPRFDLDRNIDRLVTSRWLGFPLMLLMLTAVFWITIEGANVPSGLLADLLVDIIHPALKGLAAGIGMPWWLDGLLIDGIYLAMAWVISVMLPPMAIFFPIFTLLEDFGYLPRVAFNLDNLYKRAGAHGKQSLTMAMGFGCNAAAIVSTRVIDSPRERLIAIITNNFALCNGRMAHPDPHRQHLHRRSGPRPSGRAGLGNRSGERCNSRHCPFIHRFLGPVPHHPERRGVCLQPGVAPLSPAADPADHLHLGDRPHPHRIVARRGFRHPAGAVIWLLANIEIGSLSLAEQFIENTNFFAVLVGLNGVILLAYIIAIPANEIVVPTILMLTVLSARLAGVGEGSGVMFELDSEAATAAVFQAGGWTLLTAVNLMLFSLVHNPCSTTLYTIYKETKSAKWTAISALLPVAMGFSLCFLVAQIWRLLEAG